MQKITRICVFLVSFGLFLNAHALYDCYYGFGFNTHTQKLPEKYGGNLFPDSLKQAELTAGIKFIKFGVELNYLPKSTSERVATLDPYANRFGLNYSNNPDRDRSNQLQYTKYCSSFSSQGFGFTGLFYFLSLFDIHGYVGLGACLTKLEFKNDLIGLGQDAQCRCVSLVPLQDFLILSFTAKKWIPHIKTGLKYQFDDWGRIGIEFSMKNTARFGLIYGKIDNIPKPACKIKTKNAFSSSINFQMLL